MIPESAVRRFRSALRGELHLPGEDGYERARAIWNGMIDKHPALIARCRDAGDVIEAVNFARSNQLLVAVKGGGHNVAGNAVCDGGIMIDLSLMRSVRVDSKRAVALVQAGCLLSDLDQETQKVGMAVPGGIISSTGVAGLTLGGGFGWISRKYGLSIDNLISADVVTAEGTCITASGTEAADLFWGIRGGGGNFGIVTSFEFRMHPVGPEVYSGLVVQPLEGTRAYMQFHREFVQKAPDELTVWMVVRRAPPLPFLPEAVHGQLVLVVPFVYLGDPQEGERLIAPVRNFGSPLGEAVGMNPFVGWQSGFDGLNEAGARNYWKSHYLKGLSDGLIDTVVAFARQMPSPDCEIFLPHMEGSISRVPADQTAYAHRTAPFVLNIHTRWQNPADDQTCIGWARAFFEAARPHSTGGVYVNFLSDEGDARIRDAYSEEAWQRLVELKRKYDPSNLFRLNQNIKP